MDKDSGCHCHNHEHHHRADRPSECERPKPAGRVNVEPVRELLAGGDTASEPAQKQPADDPGCDNAGEQQQQRCPIENTKVAPRQNL